MSYQIQIGNPPRTQWTIGNKLEESCGQINESQSGIFVSCFNVGQIKKAI